MKEQASSQFDLSRIGEESSTDKKANFSDNSQNLGSKNPSRPEAEEELTPSEREWRNAGRADQGRKMKSPSKARLWWITFATPIALFWLFSLTVYWGIIPINFISVKIQSFYSEESIKTYVLSTRDLIIFLVIWLVIAPWVLDIILKQVYNLRPLLLSELENKSPESVKLLTTYAEVRRIPLPALKCLPTSCPVALTYGNHPRNTCIVISRGLLSQLTDEEIATIYSTQLAHIINKDIIWMSAIVALLQIPYLLHTRFAAWAKLRQVPLLPKIMLMLSTLWYGVYQFWRLPTLWLSRQRLFDSDHQAVQLTQNPNALSRALLKMSMGMCQKIQQQGYTPQLLESFDLLLEIEPRQVMSLGSLPPNVPYDSVLAWDCTNPYRHWLGLFDSHPLLGERLYLLGRYAKFWNLESELDLSERRPSLPTKGEIWKKLITSYQALPLLSAAVLFALGFGVILRLLFWGMGKVSYSLNFKSLIWLDKSFPLLNGWVVWLFIVFIVAGLFFISDRHPHIFASVIFLRFIMEIFWNWNRLKFYWFNNIDPLFTACCLIIFSFSLIIWLNRYFPHPKHTPVLTNPSLADLLSDANAVPAQGQLVQMTGILLGYPKVNHWLGQELILQTSTGLIKLHFIGLVGNVLPWSFYPKQLLKKPVTVQGWFRRGSVPVIDVHLFKSTGGKIIRSGATHFFFVLIVISALWGTYLIRTH